MSSAVARSMISALTAGALLLAVFLPLGDRPALAQVTQCDGDFHLVHDVGDGEMNDVDFAPDGEGWAAGFDYANDESSNERPFIVRFDDERFERITPTYDPDRRFELIAIEAITSEDVYAVGHSYSRSGQPMATIFHWDGTSWTTMEAPTPGMNSYLRGVVAVAPNDVWAVGGWQRRKTLEVETFVIHYDGNGWSKVPAPSPGRNYAGLFDIDATSSNRMWAVGYRDEQDPLALRWNGSVWKVVGMRGLSFDDAESFLGIDAVTPEDIWIVGDGKRAVIVHRRRGKWRRTGFIDVKGWLSLNEVAATEGEAWTVGHFFEREQFTRTLAAHWDGSWDRARVEGRSFGDFESVALDPEGNAWAVGEMSLNPDDLYDTTEVIERACTP